MGTPGPTRPRAPRTRTPTARRAVGVGRREWARTTSGALFRAVHERPLPRNRRYTAAHKCRISRSARSAHDPVPAGRVEWLLTDLSGLEREHDVLDPRFEHSAGYPSKIRGRSCVTLADGCVEVLTRCGQDRLGSLEGRLLCGCVLRSALGATVGELDYSDFDAAWSVWWERGNASIQGRFLWPGVRFTRRSRRCGGRCRCGRCGRNEALLGWNAGSLWCNVQNHDCQRGQREKAKCSGRPAVHGLRPTTNHLRGGAAKTAGVGRPEGL